MSKCTTDIGLFKKLNESLPPQMVPVSCLAHGLYLIPGLPEPAHFATQWTASAFIAVRRGCNGIIDSKTIYAGDNHLSILNTS